MFYKEWAPIYKKIVDDFGFSIKKDKLAADILEKFLQRKKVILIKELKELIFDKEVIVFGAGPSLENSIEINQKKFQNKIKISADGATSALLKKNIHPDIIVTDLDGKVSDQIKANYNGSTLVIHAHGDSINRIKRYISEFRLNIVGTTQTDPKLYKNVYNFGGFTDGDRAVYLSNHFNAKKIHLVGFDFNDKIGKYSFSKQKNKNVKLKKLKWCKYLIEQLMKSKNNIFYF
jgi:uncharacterized Rossmann fold enzyme